MSSDKYCCVPGCKESGSMDKVLHQFPNPEKDRDRFDSWLFAIGRGVWFLNQNTLKYRRVCHSHFETKYLCRYNRISNIAVPTLHLSGSMSLTLAERQPMHLCNPSISSKSTDGDNVTMHSFPNPERDPKRFQSWLFAIGGAIFTMDDNHLYKQGRVCHNHFETQYRTWTKTLSPNAIPTLHIRGINLQQRHQEEEKDVVEDSSIHNASMSPARTDGAAQLTESSDHEKVLVVDGTDNVAMSPVHPDDDPLSQGDTELNESLREEKQCKMYEGGVCMCCMATEDLEELFTDQRGSRDHKNHAKMVQACFGIQVSEAVGHDSICRGCITRLHDAAAFKKQTLKTMSILMSVEVQELLPDIDVINILGLNEEIKDDSIWKVETIDDELLNGDVETMKKSGGDDSVTKANDEEVEQYSDYIDEDLWSSGEADTKEATKQKPPGRPRKYPKPNIPYTIGPQDTVCKECNQEFPNNLILKKHYNTHFPNFGCAQCGKSFMKAEGLQKHVRIHSGGPFVCRHCGQLFNAFYTLESHKRLKHSQRPLHGCPQCELRFSSKYIQLQHLERVHGIVEKNYKCTQCPRRFSHSVQRSKHEATHKMIEYACPLCDYTSTRPLVRAHLANKHDIGEKRFHCDICDQKFSKRWTLIEHFNSHLNIRKYTCPRCGKGFVQKGSLKCHIVAHIRKGEHVDQTV